MPKIVIGLAGEMASGKTTVAKYLEKNYQAKGYRFSDILRDILQRLYKKNARENLQKVSTLLRKSFGENILAKAIAKDVEGTKVNLIVIDGVRRLGDIEYLKKVKGFILVYLEADIEKCHQRIAIRNENVDDHGKTLEEFKQDRMREAEQQIKELKQFANFVVDNNGSVEDLYKQIDKLIEK